MKSPQVSHFVIALVFAAIAYLIAINIAFTATAIAIIVFISSLIASLITIPTPSSTAESSDVSDDAKTLYVGNLPYRANEAAVKELFSEYGQVQSVRLMKDKHTGKRRGFGFVEMSSNDISKAIDALNDTEFQQRTLKVREAKERPERVEN
jgi:RNA recognition motif-containing protein